MNVFEGISLQQHNISELARRKSAQIFRSYGGRSTFSGQPQHLSGRKSRLDKSR